MRLQDFVSLHLFKWAIALVCSIFIALFSISLAMSSATTEALGDIKIRQEVIINTLDVVQEDIKEIKYASKDDIDKIWEELDTLKERMR